MLSSSPSEVVALHVLCRLVEPSKCRKDESDGLSRKADIVDVEDPARLGGIVEVLPTCIWEVIANRLFCCMVEISTGVAGSGVRGGDARHSMSPSDLARKCDVCFGKRKPLLVCLAKCSV